MTRARAVTAESCILCRRRVPSASFEERQRLAQHRMAHRRADADRARWRAYRTRKAAGPDEKAVGYLHNLSCPGGHYARRGACKPVPVYRGEAA